MELKEIVKKIEDVKALAFATPVENSRSYNMQLGKIRRAQEDLKILLDDYRSVVRKKIVFILPSGPGAEKFASIAAEGCYHLNAKDLFKKVTNMLSPVLYDNQPFNVSTLDTAMSYFSEVADTIGITSYPQVIFKSKYARTVSSKEEFIETLKEAISDQIGSDIVGHYSVHEVAQMAVNEGFSGKAVPVILYSKDLEYISQLSESLKNITPNVFLVDSKEDVTEKEVEATLKKIKKSVV